MSSRFERVKAEPRYEGKIFTVCEEVFRHEDGEEATREIVHHTGAVGVVCHDGESLCSWPASSTSRARRRW